MPHVNSILYIISKLAVAVCDIFIVLVFSIFKNLNLVVNIAVSNVQIQIYLFLKSNVFILNIEVLCSKMLFDKCVTSYIDIYSFAETVTWRTKNCLLKKRNIKYPNYNDDQNCLHENVTKFLDFFVIFSVLHFVYFEKCKSRKVCVILCCNSGN